MIVGFLPVCLLLFIKHSAVIPFGNDITYHCGDVVEAALTRQFMKIKICQKAPIRLCVMQSAFEQIEQGLISSDNCLHLTHLSIEVPTEDYSDTLLPYIFS